MVPGAEDWQAELLPLLRAATWRAVVAVSQDAKGV